MKCISLSLALMLLPSFSTLAACAERDLDEVDRTAAFAAAGFSLSGEEYVRCDDTVTISRRPGSLEVVDLNGDGLPEVFVKESSLFCYGNTGEAFVLVAKREDGSWMVLLDQVGIPVLQETQRMGWPDIEVGGPFPEPFPTYHFDGSTYVEGQ